VPACDELGECRSLERGPVVGDQLDLDRGAGIGRGGQQVGEGLAAEPPGLGDRDLDGGDRVGSGAGRGSDVSTVRGQAQSPESLMVVVSVRSARPS
jgi:hypothetical protein